MAPDLSNVTVPVKAADITDALWRAKAEQLEADRDVAEVYLYARTEDLKQIAKYLRMDADEHIDDIELGDVPAKVYDTLAALRSEIAELRKNALTPEKALHLRQTNSWLRMPTARSRSELQNKLRRISDAGRSTGYAG